VRLENENIEDIIKCLALGADYVLLSMNNILEMSNTKTIRIMNKYIKATTLTKMLSKDKFLYDQYGNHLLSFNDWTNSFKNKLKETMCETGSSNLEEFKSVEKLVKNKENI
jgi:isopentenyl diphosphate isomerase/L-lactate dehydrogenase-like FMN-dependent dehydrogenase